MHDLLDARAKSIIDQVIDLQEPARTQQVERGCYGSPELRRRVESLLALMDKDDAFLHEPTLNIVPNSGDPAIEGAGGHIGPFTLINLIGEGGFGSVYLAEQLEPVRRRVALKIIKLGMDTRQVIARFEAERQALALMDHPNIARVLDAGATHSGRPYFVMELVRGEPITKYCDRKKLTLRQRLELFRDVCNAVQHAHQKGVIHRDLKPSNVLVTVMDELTIPKVIDFGIAKATAGRLTELTLHTEMHQLIGTPEYMSPEQTEVPGADIDTRSDIYALGVLLYELLVGSTPLERDRLQSTPFAEIQRIIREDEPPRPSHRLATLSSSSERPPSRTSGTAVGESTESAAIEIARRRRSEPLPLTRALRGDLDWIVMKCLEKDRRRRYETASALAEDVSRHLSDEPVMATPPSTGYRLRKFVRRNRTTVLAGSMMALTLIVATGVSIAFGISESRQRQSAQNDRGRAQKAEGEATQRANELESVAKFQAGQLSGIDAKKMGDRLRDDLLEDAKESMAHRRVPPCSIEQRQAELTDLLSDVNLTNVALKSLDANIFDSALKAVDVQFQDQPVIRARLLQTLAETMLRLGLANRALEPQLEALAVRRRLLGEAHPDTITSMLVMAAIFAEHGKLSDSEQTCREAVSQLRRTPLDDEALGSALKSLGLMLLLQGKLAEAEIQLREALQRLHTFGEDNSEFLGALENMGGVMMETGRPAEAEPNFRRALEGRRQSLGADDPDTIRSAANVGFSLEQQGRFSEAEPYYREAMEKRRRLLGDDHSDTILSINNMAWLADELDQHDRAGELYAEAIARARRTLGDLNPYTLRYISNFGHSMRMRGRPNDAETLYREALAGFEPQLGDTHVFTATAMAGVGGALLDQSRHAEAEPLLIEAARAFDAAQGVARMEHERCLKDLTELYDALERVEPGRGNGAKSAEWKARLNATTERLSAPPAITSERPE